MEDKRQDIRDTFNFRFATKRFDPERKIDVADFDTILEAGRLSPSSLGLEPWKFLVIQDTEVRQALKAMSWGAQGQLDTASHFVLILARKNVRPENPYVTDVLRNVKKMNDATLEQMLTKTVEFQKNNLKLYESDRALWDWASKQTYIPLGNMMTAAAYLGIDSCPIEGFQYDDVAKFLAEKGYLDAENFAPSVMVAFGYRDADPKRPKSRLSQEEVVEWI